MNEVTFNQTDNRCENTNGIEILKSLILSDHKSVSRKPQSIVLGESIKGHFDVQYGDTDNLRGIRIVGHQEYCNDVVHRGKMFLPGKDTEHCKFVPSVKQFHGIAKNASEPSNQLSRDWTGKSRLSPNESGVYNVETIMSRKNRMLSNEQQRNDIPSSSKGDKYYKEVDRERDFFKKGGLIPGSCIAIKGSTTGGTTKKDFQDVGHATSKTKLSFREKQDKELLDNELKQLRDLDNSFEHLGQEISSWEGRTGSYLIRPEDENY